MTEDREESCVLLLPGEQGAPITVGEANRIIALFNRLHLRSIRDSISEMRAEIQGFKDYMEDEKEMHAQMLGGIKTLKWIGVFIAGLLAAVAALLLIVERASRVGVIIGGP